MKRIIGAAAAILLLAGCGGTATKDAQYADAGELIDAATSAGYDCPARAISATKHDGGVNEGRCLSGNRDQFIVFTDAQAVTAARESLVFGTQMTMVANREDAALLIGPNWAIRGPESRVRKLEAKLGGYLPDLSDVRMPTSR